jgi:two-component system, NarL family, sensor histidine kinase UhpB
MRELTGRKRTEEALRESEERFRDLVENSSDGIILIQRDGRIGYMSPAASRILGYTAEALAGSVCLDLVHSEDQEVAREAAQRCLGAADRSARALLRVRHRDGSWRRVEFSALNRLARPAIGAVVVNFRDLTEQGLMEEAIRDSDQFNQEIVSGATEGIVVFDRDLRSLVWNRFMEDLMEIPASDVIGRPVAELFPDLVKQGMDRLMARALAGETVSSEDVPYRAPRSGRNGWISITFGPHRNAREDIVGVIAIVRDLTERKRSEEALKESERQFRAVFEGAGDALLIFDDGARFVDVNPAACELYGRPREELLGRRMEDLRTAAYAFEDVWREFLRLGHVRGEIRVPRPDGTVRDAEYLSTARFLPGRHLTIQRDVTERHRAERRGQVFSELGLKLSSAQTATDAARVISGCADALCHWDACTVDLYSEESDRVEPLLTVDTIGGERLSVPPVRVNVPPSPRQRRVLREGPQILLREKPVTESDSIPFGDTARLSRSILIAPIRAGASVIGFISVQSYESNAYEERDLESLQGLADLCGGAFVRLRAFEELRRGEQKLREAQAIGRIGSWERDLRDGSVTWSEEMYRFFGLDPRSFRPTLEGIIERVLPQDRIAVQQERENAVRECRASQQEFRIGKGDGSVAVIQTRGDVILDEAGEPVRMVGVAHDVTEQRRAEERLRRSYEELRALSQRLGAVREEEGARIAREVHDEVGQALTALKLDLSWVGKRLGRARRGADSDLQPKLAAMEELIDSTLDAVQRISTELRPGVLHELGLEAAVGWYAREFQKRTEIVCRFQSNLAGATLDDGRSTATFRILQEILTNVARHAGATEVEIALGRENGSLVLEARDNGKGISEDRISDSRSLGLVGMRERARSFGGSVAIRGRSGGGTAVAVRIPL